METNDIIDEHLIHDPHEGLGRLQSVIRTSGILAIIGAILGILGIFQQLFSIGRQVFSLMSSVFGEYMFYGISTILFGSITIILEAALTLFLFKFGLSAVNAGKKALGQQEWETLFKDLRNILMVIAGYIVVTLFSYVVNILINLILG
ncbi:MAG: hypothetical protein ACI94Y_000647 [Maribacter sp.]|jgi:hypothetical protein